MVRFGTAVLALALLLPSGTLAQSQPVPATRTDNAYITGEVKNPGVYPWVKGMTVLQLIAAAGGLLPSADRNVSIVSGTATNDIGQPLTYVVDFRELMLGKNLAKNNVQLQPSDVVIVRPAKGLTADELRAKLSAELKKK